jgi:hypothetical protein
MFSRHQERGAPGPGRLTFIDPSVPSRACCCPARPAVKVIMPPAPDRPRPVDLWLCEHHYRASIVALELAGAGVENFGSVPDGVDAGHAVPVV